MTDLIGAIWVGTMCAWFGYAFSERRHRRDLPQWKAIVGDALINQMQRVAANHKFAGDDVLVQSQQTYDGKFGRMVVTVERAEVAA